MIDILQLTNDEIGHQVIFTDGVGDKIPGRIRSWNDKYIFVMYGQNSEAQATNPKYLKFA